ncbi:MAG: phosphoribosylanthranilate isomerase [Calditerrivibrio sp.]|nr:phosphoribosylanthranilate isomerase [Calditerrivibrio sp.]
MFVKVCGLTEKEQVDWAVDLGFSAIGVVFYPFSKRFVGLEKGVELAEYAKGRIKTVAVGIRYDEVKAVEPFFDFIQIEEYLEKPTLILSIDDKPTKENSMYIFDKSKGKGILSEIPDWFFAIRDKTILAGGLNSDNILDIIIKFEPFGVDVSSGVEIAPGKKDWRLMEDFIKKCSSLEAI